jgi:hypothetical protein
MRLSVYDYFRLILNLPVLIALVVAALVFSPYGGTWSGRCRKLSQSWNISAKIQGFLAQYLAEETDQRDRHHAW